MDELTERDYRSSLDFVAAICSERDPQGFRGTLVRSLTELIPCDVASFNLVRPDGLTAVDAPYGTCSPELRFALLSRIGDHPMVSYATMSGDDRPHRLSDFCSDREFTSTGLYADFYRKLGLRREISFTVACGRDTVLAIGMNRTSSNFTDRELELLRLVAPYIVLAHRGLERADAFRRGSLAAVDHILTRREREVLAIAATGNTNIEIGRILGISARTVQKHLENAYRKLAVHRRTAAATVFLNGTARA